MDGEKSRKMVLRLVWSGIVGLSLISATSLLPIFEHQLFMPLVIHHGPTQTPRIFTYPLISEVLYDPINDEPAGEWIELYNPGDVPIDLSDIKIGDAEVRGDHEGMLRFPVGTTMAAGSAVVIANQAVAFAAEYGFNPDFEAVESDLQVPNMIKYFPWAGYSLELTDNGDEVLLLDSQDQVVDALSWGASTFAFDPAARRVPQGYSLERRPADVDQDSAGDWHSQSQPAPGRVDLVRPTSTPTATGTMTPTATFTPTNTSPPCEGDPLLISEVLFDPESDLDPQGEWFEIYNPGDKIVHLGCYRVGDEETQGEGEGMFGFPLGYTLPPRNLVVVANQAAVFLETYGFSPNFELFDTDPSVPEMVKDAQWASGGLNLSNAGDEMLLMDSENRLVDAVSWGDSIFAFDPSAIAVVEGHSLERVPADQDRNLAADWRDQPVPQPGNLDFSTPTPVPSLTLTATGTQTSTPTITPLPCGTASLLLSEVLYDPFGSTDTGGEWFEIHNPGEQSVNLACIKIGDEETQGSGEGMLIFPGNSIIQPKGIVVVANRASIFYGSYGFVPEFEVIDSDPEVPDMLRYTSWASGSINLSNSGDEVLILDWLDRIVDVVSWGSSTFAFTPSVLLVPEGSSLERIPSDKDTDTAGDWYPQANPNPGAILGKIPTPTLTPTRSKTPTQTPSKTSTPLKTPTKTATVTLTRTSTKTLVASKTPTITAINTITRTPTRTITPAPSMTCSPTITISPTQTSTFTPTNTRTPVASSSLTPSPTLTPTPLPSPTPTLTMTASPTPTEPGPNDIVLITEVTYAFGFRVDRQWIEIYNPGNVTVDLSAYKLGDAEIPGINEGMLQFPSGTLISPRQVLIVAIKAAFFYDEYNFYPDFEFTDTNLTVPDMLPYPSWSDGMVLLNNMGDEVLLLDGEDRIVDVVAYGDSLFPDFQPPVVGVAEGYSLERFPADQDTDGKADWIKQPRPNPGVVNLGN